MGFDDSVCWVGLLLLYSTAHRDFEKFPKYLGGQRRDLDKSPKMHLQGISNWEVSTETGEKILESIELFSSEISLEPWYFHSWSVGWYRLIGCGKNNRSIIALFIESADSGYWPRL